jgi:Domain of unknown function (DUF4331)
MSHHFDSPTAIEDGRLNLCDIYVFPETQGTSTLVLTVNPDSGRSNPTTFRPDALYEFVIASDGGTREDRAFRMSFGEPGAGGNQEMQVRYAVGPSRSGLEGSELGVGHTGQAFALSNGGSAWFGLAQDPFWGDAVSLFAFNHGLADNQYRPELFTGTPGNLLAGRNVTAIALHVPDAMFGGIDVAMWARISPVRACPPAPGQPGRPSVVAVILLPAAGRRHRGTQRRFAGRRRRRVHRRRAADRRACGRTEPSRQPRRARCGACGCIPPRPAAIPARPAGALRARHGKRPQPARRRARNHAVADSRPSTWRNHLALPSGG